MAFLFIGQDMDTIQRIKEKALNDPEEFISILKAGGDLGVPHRQLLAEVRYQPELSFSIVFINLPLIWFFTF